MAYKRKYKIYVGDFETTSYEGQEYTEVWASAIVKLFTEDVKILSSIDETFSYLISLNENIIIYYHNLKFDGAFWIDYLLIQLGYKQALNQKSANEFDVEFMEDYEMPDKTFKYLISDRGQWYNIIVKVNGKYIVFRDSLKLLPFSVKEIGKSFKTIHQKTEIEYTGFRYAGCEITAKEREYIANDVLVIKEALEIMVQRGHTKMTIGSCCLSEFRKTIDEDCWKFYFPDLRDYQLNKDEYGCSTAEQYVRKTYKGGWCYLATGKENTVYYDGCTADVNSLYPSMMHSESGNEYPIGEPHFWKGNYIPTEVKENNYYYFIRIRTHFYLRKDMLPTIQIKGNLLYRSTEWLKTSDVYNDKIGKYQRYYIDLNGVKTDTSVILSLTGVDYELMREHYILKDFEILDGCWFYTVSGLFDEYINKYRKIKENSTGAERQLAKLFLNNLYGKMATSPVSDQKVAIITNDETVSFINIQSEEKDPVYIPIGSAITSYARRFTITAAQVNYYGKDKSGFIYADTDSIHCDLPKELLKQVPIHETAFCHWKIETEWDNAIFVRQKTYIEHAKEIKKDKKEEDMDEEEYEINMAKKAYIVRCAGMPEVCKDLLLSSIVGYTEKQYNKFSDNDKEFVKQHRTLSDFGIGLKIPDKLMPKRIRGGIVLKETTYEMR